MTSRGKRATIADVARAAGVALSTVSRVLNNSPKSSRKARDRVMRAIKETGFVVNRQGRALAVGRSEAIALLFTDPLEELFTDPTYARLCHGIVSRLADGPNLPMILEAATRAERERVVEHMGRGAVDAVIVITPYEGGASSWPGFASSDCPSSCVASWRAIPTAVFSRASTPMTSRARRSPHRPSWTRAGARSSA